MYPYIATFYGMPCNSYHHLVYSDMKENLFLENNLFFYKKKNWALPKRAYGVFQVRLYLPHDNALQNYPFLPCPVTRGKQKKMYLPNCYHCLCRQARGKCYCSVELRAFVGVYCKCAEIRHFAFCKLCKIVMFCRFS